MHADHSALKGTESTETGSWQGTRAVGVIPGERQHLAPEEQGQDQELKEGLGHGPHDSKKGGGQAV